MKFATNIRAMFLCTLLTGSLAICMMTAPAAKAKLDPQPMTIATANAGPDLTVYAGESVRLDGTGSTETDPRWETGDGYAIDSLLKAPHVYTTPGRYTARLTVGGSADTTSVTVLPIEALSSQVLTDSGDPNTNRSNLQAALNAAALNPNSNEIVVPAGFTLNDTIIVPKREKAFGTYVTVRVADLSSLPDGTRVSRDDRSKMFRINAQAASVSGYNYAILIGSGSNYFRFVGMDVVRTGPAGNFKNDIVGVDFDDTDKRPSHIILDRVIIDGNGTETVRGFAPNGSEFSLLNSSIYDIKAAGYESKAIGVWRGAGNLAVVNNRLEAASINFIVGGSYAADADRPDGVVFRGNYSWKNPEWLNRGYGIKNLFELKFGTNVVAEGNTFENNWGDAQNGMGVLFTVRGDGNLGSTIREVSFRYNTVRNSKGGVNVLGKDDSAASTEINNLRIENNYFYSIAGPALQLLTHGGKNINFKHNTVRMLPGAGAAISIDGPTGGLMQTFV